MEEPLAITHQWEAHGVLGSLAWGVIAPLGAIMIRVVPSSKAWLVHGGVMLFGLMMFTGNFGIGVYRMIEYGSAIGDKAHFIIGTLLFSLAWLQPFLGTAHHFLYKKVDRRSVISAIHVFFGRLFMLVGIINGGVGLLLAENSTRAQNIAYGTVTGIIWVSYILVALYWDVSRETQKIEVVKSAVHTRSPSESSVGMDVVKDKEMSE